jgi:uncharacterized membrane protein
MFGGLAEDDLENLARGVTERSYDAGSMIFDQGNAGSEMFIIAAGDVNIHLPGEGSRRISLKDLGVGEYFGELALFDDKPRSASALATTATSLLVLTRKTLEEYLDRRPRAAMTILRTMSARLRETNAMLSDRAAKNVVEELEKNLRWTDRLADKVAELNGSWAFILLLFALTGLWVLINSLVLPHFNPQHDASNSFDPYPYVFYNLLLAILVALQGPLIVMSQNRQSTKDRATADNDYRVNLKNEVNIETIMRELGEFRTETNQRLIELEARAATPNPEG